MAEAPAWLLTMRAISGMTETPGAADNPKIMAMADEIARIFPEMKSYCDSYRADSVPWCGLTVAYTMAKVNIRPPFVAGKDTDCFLWARSWADDNGYQILKTPRLGCVVVLTRSGGGHVTLYESTRSDGMLMCRGGNQNDAINLQPFSKANVLQFVWPSAEPIPDPIEPPADELPILRKGDTGPAVVKLQELLPKWIDGDFGTTTESLVKEFQRSQGLAIDGVVGEQTWAALLDEDTAPVLPPVSEGDWIHGITATWFGGSGETEMSAYAPYDRITATEISVALPYRFKGELPRVEVMNEDGDVAIAIIRDIGPWMIDDCYWDKGTRPIAEQCYATKTPLPSGPQKGRVPSNPAGIDLSSALAKLLGTDGMGKVSWRLVE